jgi:glutaredoxin-like protein
MDAVTDGLPRRDASHRNHTVTTERDRTALGDQPTITVYWRPGCPFCAVLKRSLNRAGVTTTLVNIWDDPAAAAAVREVAHGNETVPTVEIGGRWMVNPSAKQVLAAAGHAPTRSGGRRRLFRT